MSENRWDNHPDALMLTALKDIEDAGKWFTRDDDMDDDECVDGVHLDMADPKWEPDNRHHRENRNRAMIFLATTEAKTERIALLKVDVLASWLRTYHPKGGMADYTVDGRLVEGAWKDMFMLYAGAVVKELVRLMSPTPSWEPEPPNAPSRPDLDHRTMP
jgi:hypothetical protein